MTRAITLRAPAKINITLEVLRKRPDGYHDIRSVFVRLDKLCDTIRMRVSADGAGIGITTNSAHIPIDATNICHQAAERYLTAARVTARVDLHIDKRIPVAAGLGGGSSDAAAVLRGLNRHFGNRMPARKLAALGSDIGKDVPFFLHGEACAHLSGTGDVIKALPVLPRTQFLVINPGVTIATRDAYAALDRSLWFMASNDRANRSHAMKRAIDSRSVVAIAAALYNDFEATVERSHPIIKELKQALLAFGASGALMSGSGPTVFGVFESRATLLRAQEHLREHYPSLFIAGA